MKSMAHAMWLAANQELIKRTKKKKKWEEEINRGYLISRAGIKTGHNVQLMWNL